MNIFEKIQKLEEENYNSEEMFKKAKQYFGTLELNKKNFQKIAYILPDGSCLDFSGGWPFRKFLHSKIFEIGIIQDDFINLGAIRVDGQLGVLDIAIEPSLKQLEVIKNFLSYLTIDKLDISYKSKFYKIKNPNKNINMILNIISPNINVDSSNINNPHYWVTNEPNRFKLETFNILEKLKKLMLKK